MSVDPLYLTAGILLSLLLLATCFLGEGASQGNPRRVARVGVLTSVALIFGLLESFLPDLFLPGMRIGLANIVPLTILFVYGFKEGLAVSLLKAVLVSLLRGNFLAMGGLMALSGSLLSFLAMAAIHYGFKRFSVIGVSIFGALFHITGQFLVAYLFLGVGVLGYLPLLALISFFTGALIGVISHLLLRHKAFVAYLRA